TWPQLIIPTKEDKKYQLGKYNPKTKLLVGFTYSDRPEYRRRISTMSGTYTWQNKRTHQYSLTLLNLNMIDTIFLSGDFKKDLEEQAKDGNFSLVNSFNPSFVSSIIFGITWNKNYFGNFENNASWIRAQIEPGGSIWNFVDPTFINNAGLEYYKYIRLSLDIRKTKVLSKTSTIAFHFNSGLGYGYASNKSLPYEKLFFAGGSNSIRAWRPRRLGPGSFKPNLSDDPEGNGLFDYNIEKPADILLEGSIELRQKLFWFYLELL
ncbi:MAG: BamA/TamA family outer membrane protein, partial [Saprospiraceae bacterium]|nr:BamA/TamA family outer membrane protein [Saprospiraceae bacterium]